jgi:hypothetical protein
MRLAGVRLASQSHTVHPVQVPAVAGVFLQLLVERTEFFLLGAGKVTKGLKFRCRRPRSASTWRQSPSRAVRADSARCCRLWLQDQGDGPGEGRCPSREEHDLASSNLQPSAVLGLFTAFGQRAPGFQDLEERLLQIGVEHFAVLVEIDNVAVLSNCSDSLGTQ